MSHVKFLTTAKTVGFGKIAKNYLSKITVPSSLVVVKVEGGVGSHAPSNFLLFSPAPLTLVCQVVRHSDNVRHLIRTLGHSSLRVSSPNLPQVNKATKTNFQN